MPKKSSAKIMRGCKLVGSQDRVVITTPEPLPYSVFESGKRQVARISGAVQALRAWESREVTIHLKGERNIADGKIYRVINQAAEAFGIEVKDDVTVVHDGPKNCGC